MRLLLKEVFVLLLMLRMPLLQLKEAFVLRQKRCLNFHPKLLLYSSSTGY